MAAYSRNIFWALLILFGDRMATSMTLVINSFFQIVIYSNPFVKYKAFAVPFRIRFIDIFKIL